MRFTIKNPPHLAAITAETVSRFAIADVMFVAGKRGGSAYAYATDGRRLVAAPVGASAAAQDALLPRDVFKPKVDRVDVNAKAVRINGERSVPMPTSTTFPPLQDVIPAAGPRVTWIALNAKFLLDLATAINSVAVPENEHAIRVGVLEGDGRVILVQSIDASHAIGVLMPVAFSPSVSMSYQERAHADWNAARDLILKNLGESQRPKTAKKRVADGSKA